MGLGLKQRVGVAKPSAAAINEPKKWYQVSEKKKASDDSVDIVQKMKTKFQTQINVLKHLESERKISLDRADQFLTIDRATNYATNGKKNTDIDLKTIDDYDETPLPKGKGKVEQKKSIASKSSKKVDHQVTMFDEHITENSKDSLVQSESLSEQGKSNSDNNSLKS